MMIDKITLQQQQQNYSSSSVAGMVTLYNSDHRVVSRIATYVKQVEKLYVVDNSDNPDEQLIQKIKLTYANVIYISSNGNKGIAHALNAAAKAAVDDEFAYLLMMDDDSEATDNMVEAMLTYLRQQAEHDMIGIIAAQSDPNLFGNTARKVWFTITSGSMLNMETYKQCGPFQNELFIDAVDHEYCFRIIQAGYQVINLDYLHLSHKIGELKQLRFFNITFYKWASHNPTRIYYMLRNFLHVLRKYRKILPMRTKFLIVYALTTSCFVNALFEKDTLLRLRYLSKAISDFNNNKMGKLSQAID